VHSLSGQLLSEVSGPVWVIAKCDCRVICKSLQRDNELQSWERGSRPPNLEDLLLRSCELRKELRIITISDDNWEDFYVVGLKFAHNIDSWGFRIFEHDKDAWDWLLSRVYIPKEIVADVVDWEALAVQVRQLLHLQRALISNSLR